MMPILLMIVAVYFIMLRPAQKKQRDEAEWRKNLQKGDEVVTTGGLVGRISGLTENMVTLEVQEKVRLKVLRSHIAGKPPTPVKTAAAADTSASKEASDSKKDEGKT